ncbi:ECF-type sigma factor [Roseateles oligotrophus]|uniref:Sigma-70 family RNA polymerase sigma factor n=1 Tax=Roseateles oligotrophus TaxID=1769250 RepID=A0ABT2YIR8_9BURK|nr:ECF-type sigma factor [Roseateles oligotrophus]MCV2369820.1 sigma-70 family RNA polymerase sigma factor [Roseateles oligotrophus]
METNPACADLTLWLQQLDGGASASSEHAASPANSAQAVNQVFTALYGELKRAASAQMRKESAGHTLSATALTHEAWFRLKEQTRTDWQSRAHFMGVAALMMRRILVNHAIAKQAAKREAELVSLNLTEAEEIGQSINSEVVQVHEALLAFELIDARAAKVVELKFFGGLEIDEIADLLAISAATVKRDWTMARAWLHRELAQR